MSLVDVLETEVNCSVTVSWALTSDGATQFSLTVA